MVVTVGWDPFARAGLDRVAVGPGLCDWCGQQRQTLYTYLSTDARLKPRRIRKFCNLGCYRAFWG